MNLEVLHKNEVSIYSPTRCVYVFLAYSNADTRLLESLESDLLKIHREDFFTFQELLLMIFVNFDGKQKLTS